MEDVSEAWKLSRPERRRLLIRHALSAMESSDRIEPKVAAAVAAIFITREEYPTYHGLAKALLNRLSEAGAAITLVEMLFPSVEWFLSRKHCTLSLTIECAGTSTVTVDGWAPSQETGMGYPILMAFFRAILAPELAEHIDKYLDEAPASEDRAAALRLVEEYAAMEIQKS